MHEPDPPVRQELLELATAYGVAGEYEDWRGERVRVPTETLRRVLSAFGVRCGSSGEISAALADADSAPWRRTLPPVVVTRQGADHVVPLHSIPGVPVQAWIELESGGKRHNLHQSFAEKSSRHVDGVQVTRTSLWLPADLPLGWHRLHAVCGDREALAPVAVTPSYVGLPASMGKERAWGLMVQLYSLRSRRSWGMGEFADLAGLVALSGTEYGVGMVLVNPLHAAEPVTPIEPSPYLPTSRRFADPLYLRVADIPEYDRLTPAARSRVEELAAPLLASSAQRDPGLLDRDAVWKSKRAALELVFESGLSEQRRAHFGSYCSREGEALVDYATWCALAERHGLPWQEWPGRLQDPRSPAVAEERAELALRVDFHCWLQWQADEQMETAQRTATRAGMPIGVVHDLAVGVSPGGADAWRLGGTLAHGVSAGAPPDAFNQQGQDWGQPPWSPDQLEEAAYVPFREMLRYALRHAGGLRIDHIIGFFRLWWVPNGASPSDGTYVRYDHDALIGILALEAYRADAVVIGEDLGTVEPWVRAYLAERGLLGTSMLWFEKQPGAQQDKPLPPERWRQLCLATVGTHDMPPIAGYLAGDHIDLRERLGLLARSPEAERAADETGRRAWLEELRGRGLLSQEAGEWEVVLALHAFLARTPARLLGAALADVTGERRTQNQPGTTEEYPNWRLPLAGPEGRPVLLEDLSGSSRMRQLARVLDGPPPG